MNRELAIEQLKALASAPFDRKARAQRIAAVIRATGNHRWVGLYDVHYDQNEVRVFAFNGPGAPTHPKFAIGEGITSAAIESRKTINVPDVESDPRYLTSFGDTASEIIIPVLGENGQRVAGTIDVESAIINAFPPDEQEFLERCAEIIRPLWSSNGATEQGRETTAR